MRLLAVVLAVLAAACTQAPPGTIGLPTAAPTTRPPATATANQSGAPSASASPSGSPTIVRIIGASATQYSLELRYNEPMRSGIACGASGRPGDGEGAIDRLSKYVTSDDAYTEALRSATSATLAADCSAVTFIFAAPAPAGTFTVSAIGMVARDGTGGSASPSEARVTIADEGRPRLAGASSTGDSITVSFSEPMIDRGPTGVLTLGNYHLDGAQPPAQLECTDAGCRAVRLTLPAGTLVPGRGYALRVGNVADRSGVAISPDPTTTSFTVPRTAPSAPPGARAGVASVLGTQVSLTVVFTAPMRTGLACGATGVALSPPAGAVDDLAQPSLAAHFIVADSALQESIQSSRQATVSADCRTLTLHFAVSAPAGSFPLDVRDVRDRSGELIDPTRGGATLAIADEGRPLVGRVERFADVLVVTYTEPMLQIGGAGGVTLVSNYRLDGATPSDARISCLDLGCRRVQLTMRPGTFAASRTYELRIANVVDRAGKAISPDPTTVAFR